MKKSRAICQIVFLATVALAICEFVFVRGQFTWLMAVGAVCVTGLIDAALALRDRAWLAAVQDVLTAAAVCMAYTPFLA